jgi:hypothetical protein
MRMAGFPSARRRDRRCRGHARQTRRSEDGAAPRARRDACGALIAPRPLLIASANQDGIFPIVSIREVHGQLQRLYRTLDVAENLGFVETPGGHSYHERSRTAIFSWFLKHLASKAVAAEDAAAARRVRGVRARGRTARSVSHTRMLAIERGGRDPRHRW